MPGSVIKAVSAALEKEITKPLEPGLYLVATPIGNLSDITLRALSVLARADHIYCEDTRQTQKIINHYNLTGRLSIYNDHNAQHERPKVLKKLAEGASIAIVSDAGTPLISDPGYKLVRDAIEQSATIYSIPGPSAVLTALTTSGLPTDCFFFAGFLPPRIAAAKKRLEEFAAIPGTLIFFEAASRLERTIEVLGEAFPGRQAVFARELTKRFEEMIRVTLPAGEIIKRDWKGECVVLISPPLNMPPDDQEIEAALRGAMQRRSLRDAVEEVRGTLRVPRKQVYDLALQIQKCLETGDDR
jgi:16S rRNA (cytidine1402-2'-O)-methyltransferase